MYSIPGRIEKLIYPPQCIFASSRPCRQLRINLPQLPLEVWLEIFQFATYVHRSATISPLDPFTLKRVSNNVMGTNTLSLAMRTKLSLSLVCHAWRRVTLQMLWEHVIILSPARACAILTVLQAHASDSAVSRNTSHGYGLSTRHIEIYTHARGTRQLSFLKTIFQILQCCPNLRMLSGTWCHTLPAEFLKGVSKLHGHKLQGLYWNEEGHSFPSNDPSFGPLEFIGAFQALRVLDISNFVMHSTGDLKPSLAQRISLPHVQDLVVSTHSRSLGLATNISFPTLRNLTLLASVGHPIPTDSLTSFLKVHGTSLVSIDVPSPPINIDPDARFNRLHISLDSFLDPDVCPNLTTFTFPVTSPLIGPCVHAGLRRIGLRGIQTRGLYPDKATATSAHLLSITQDRYPNLEMVKTVGFLVEADTDSLIKDIFIWWVEKFEKRGIDFLDGEGVLWAYTERLVEPGATEAGSLNTEPPLKMTKLES